MDFFTNESLVSSKKMSVIRLFAGLRIGCPHFFKFISDSLFKILRDWLMNLLAGHYARIFFDKTNYLKRMKPKNEIKSLFLTTQ